MKWFRHNSDSNDNLKFQELLDKYKMIGYGTWWVCCEMVANHTEIKKLSFSLSSKLNWKKHLRKKTGISFQTLDAILQVLAECDLINKRALKRGSLSIPKMKDWMDEYSISVTRGYRHSKHQVNTKSSNSTLPTIHNNTNITEHNNTESDSFNKLNNDVALNKKKLEEGFNFPK